MLCRGGGGWWRVWLVGVGVAGESLFAFSWPGPGAEGSRGCAELTAVSSPAPPPPPPEGPDTPAAPLPPMPASPTPCASSAWTTDDVFDDGERETLSPPRESEESPPPTLSRPRESPPPRPPPPPPPPAPSDGSTTNDSSIAVPFPPPAPACRDALGLAPPRLPAKAPPLLRNPPLDPWVKTSAPVRSSTPWHDWHRNSSRALPLPPPPPPLPCPLILVARSIGFFGRRQGSEVRRRRALGRGVLCLTVPRFIRSCKMVNPIHPKPQSGRLSGHRSQPVCSSWGQGEKETQAAINNQNTEPRPLPALGVGRGCDTVHSRECARVHAGSARRPSAALTTRWGDWMGGLLSLGASKSEASGGEHGDSANASEATGRLPRWRRGADDMIPDEHGE
jgi:hypothetical protein